MEKVNIYAFADEAGQAVDSQIAAMKRNGLRGLEIRGVDGTNVSDITLDKAREVKDKLSVNGLVTWSIGSPIGKINITDDFSQHLDKFKHTLEIANVLEAKNVRLFSFYIPEGVNPDDCKGEVIDRLGEFTLAAKNSGIALCHENEKGIYGDTPERCLEIHKTLPLIRGIFDPANYVQCGVDTLKAWELLKNYIKYMHIKDSRLDGSVVPAGEGAGTVRFIANDFISRGGNDFTIEPHLTVFEGLKSLEREGEESGIGEFRYPDADTAFDAACNAFKQILK